MLGNQVELWETMLAAMKLGAVVIPATTLLAEADLRDRIERGKARHVIVRSADAGKLDGVPATTRGSRSASAVDGWLSYATPTGAGGRSRPTARRTRPTRCSCTSRRGTTARPKLVEHTHASYPVGHLSTMYWLGLKPGDVHLNLSSPGWAKHAWSNFFAPWLAEATVAIFNYERFDAARAARRDRHARRHDVLRAADRLADADPGRPRLGARPQLREVVGAGEPLNPEIIEQRASRLGPDAARRLRADRDDGADRQHARPAVEARLDGPPAAGLRGRARRPRDRRAGRRGRDLPRPRRSGRSG